jgi:hypothetical protein
MFPRSQAYLPGSLIAFHLSQSSVAFKKYMADPADRLPVVNTEEAQCPMKGKWNVEADQSLQGMFSLECYTFYLKEEKKRGKTCHKITRGQLLAWWKVHSRTLHLKVTGDN